MFNVWEIYPVIEISPEWFPEYQWMLMPISLQFKLYPNYSSNNRDYTHLISFYIPNISSLSSVLMYRTKSPWDDMYVDIFQIVCSVRIVIILWLFTYIGNEYISYHYLLNIQSVGLLLLYYLFLIWDIYLKYYCTISNEMDNICRIVFMSMIYCLIFMEYLITYKISNKQLYIFESQFRFSNIILISGIFCINH
jgi:hypothetical protein